MAFNFVYTFYHNKKLEKIEALYLRGPEERALASYRYDYLYEVTSARGLAIFSGKIGYSEEYYRLKKKMIEIEKLIAGKAVDPEDPQVKQLNATASAEYRELVEQGKIKEE